MQTDPFIEAEVTPIISFSGVSKRFGSHWANRHISFDILEGEIHAIVGENGAGKSTLMKMLFGSFQPDEGHILLRGRPVSLSHPREAMRRGIGMVHQQLLIFPQLTALENIMVGAEPSKWGWIKRKSAEEKVREICKVFGFTMPFDSPAEALSFAQWQQIEIARLLYRGTTVLVLDEPTSLLSPPEVEQLLQFLLSLKSKGSTILFISHRLQEVFALADRISILRRGSHTGTFLASRTTTDQIASLIVTGIEQAPTARKDPEIPPSPGRSLLEIHGIDVLPEGHEAGLHDFSLAVYEGEILGIGGVVGNGQRTLARCVAGIEAVSEGRITFNGLDITHSSVFERRRAGMRWLPANPPEEALMPNASLRDNLLLGFQHDARFQKSGWMLPDRIEQWASNCLSEREVAFSSLEARISDLSGGNQQKLCLASVMEGLPRLILLEQPGRGLDIRAQERLHLRIRDLNEEGATFVLFSHDLDELLALSHRVGILFRGKLMGIANRNELSTEILGKWMLGIEAAPAGAVLTDSTVE